MLQIVECDHREKWNKIVRSFKSWDIYYLNEYAYSLSLHGDGKPYLLYFEDGEERLCYVVMKRDIADDPQFTNILEKGKYFDLETPYGYGGPLTDSKISAVTQRKFKEQLFEVCNKEQIVEQFIRFHPLLANEISLEEVIETRYMHDTIAIDTIDENTVLSNMKKECRNRIRKAKNYNIKIINRSIAEYSDFLPIYYETMDRDNADKYYYYQDDYFNSLSSFGKMARVFYALKDDKPIAGTIVFFNDQFVHYHLSGILTDYRKYAATDYLLYEVALWASQNGIRKFHLGGGMSQDDDLFKFKKKFNKQGMLRFYVGRTIFDESAYDHLLSLREKKDSKFVRNNSRMTQYRA